MSVYQASYFRYFLLFSSFLFVLSACGYTRPDGNWVLLDASEIYFSGVELGNEAIDPSYKATCEEARDEIKAQLINKLPGKIAPLVLKTTEIPDDKSATAAFLKLEITQCEIDVDQIGDSFTYYMTLPLRVTVTQNNEKLLSYKMDTYEQVQINNPGPEFEFFFTEPVERTLLLFNGKKLWLPVTH